MISLDIEVAWTQDEAELEAAHPLPEPPPPLDRATFKFGNWKDPAKLDEKFAEAVAAREETIAKAKAERDKAIREAWQSSSLDSMRGPVLCVGVAVGDNDPVCIWEATEQETLAKLQAGLVHHGHAPIVTWNGLGYDQPYLFRRALKYGLYPLAGRVFYPKPYGNRRHCDLFGLWAASQRKGKQGEYHTPWKLANVARHMGIEVKDTLDGDDVPRTWHEAISVEQRAEAKRLITEHVLEDVRVTREIARVFDACGILGMAA